MSNAYEFVYCIKNENEKIYYLRHMNLYEYLLIFQYHDILLNDSLINEMHLSSLLEEITIHDKYDPFYVEFEPSEKMKQLIKEGSIWSRFIGTNDNECVECKK